MKRALLVMFLLLAGTGYSIAQHTPKHRIVMQLASSDTAAWKSTINNIRNLKKGWGKDVAIELVAHGPGIGFLLQQKTTQLDAIKTLKEQGVVFVACENTLREKKINKLAVVPEAGFVPMGLGEIVLKQEEGWSYLKAGF